MRRSPVLRLIAGVLLAACSDETGPSNAGPTAAFTADCAPLECTFTDASTDVDGTIEGYDWDFGDRTAHATTRHAVHTYAAAGRFVVTLTVTDDGGSTSTASYQVDVTAPNVTPTARFTVSCNLLTCAFANGSFDGNTGGSVASYSWDFGDGSPNETARHATHTYAGPGQYTVSLFVRDNQGSFASATKELDLRSPNGPPTAGFTFLCADLACEFTDQSFDAEGSVVQHGWSFGDGQVSSERSPAHTFGSAGVYFVVLTVIDDRGMTGSTMQEVAVPPPPPTAYIGVGCTSLTCNFSGESIGYRPVVRYEWDFGDGGTSDQPYPQHTYASAGTYTVGLTVTDDRGQSGHASTPVTVPAPGPAAAFTVACASLTCSFTNTSTGVFLEGVHWDFGDGETSSAWNPTHVYQVTAQTTFTVALTVWDWDFGGSTVTQEVTVTPAGPGTLRITAE